MAAGDLTRDSGFPKASGDTWLLCGTVEVDDTLRAFELMSTKSYLLDVQVTDTDGVGSAQVRINENASGTTTNGTVAIQGNHQSTETYRYIARYIL